MPSLLQKCRERLADLMNDDPEEWLHVRTLPMDLLTSLLLLLTPLSLQAIHTHPSVARTLHHSESSEEDMTQRKDASPMKRKFTEVASSSYLQHCFNSAWKSHVNRRWASGLKRRYHNVFPPCSIEIEILGLTQDEANADWQQLYWEAHLQECLNEAAAQASSPFFKGSIGDVILPGTLLIQICPNIIDRKDASSSIDGFSTLKYHCWHFGLYTKYLRLRSVLLSSDLTNLLVHVRLQHVALFSILNETHVKGMCQLIGHKKEHLEVMELHQSRLSSAALDDIFKSFATGGKPNNVLKHIFILSSCISVKDSQISCSACAFHDFIHTCRCLHSIVLSDNQLSSLSAARIVFILLEAARTWTILRLSENELGGLFAKEISRLLPSIQASKVNQSPPSLNLKVLDLRSNLLDSKAIASFSICLKFLPLLQKLNLSENLIGDDGIKELLPYIGEIALLDINVSACGLSSIGALLLLEILSLSKHPLKHISLANNSLGRSMAFPLGKFLAKGLVERLDIGDIELGSSGCFDLEEAIACAPNLNHLIICKNRMGPAGGRLICKLISKVSSLKVIDSSWNLLDFESLKNIIVELELQNRDSSGGRLQLLDIRGNPDPEASKLFENISRCGEPIVLFSHFNKQFSQWHDDDP